jgi:hypothetical protein
MFCFDAIEFANSPAVWDGGAGEVGGGGVGSGGAKASRGESGEQGEARNDDDGGGKQRAPPAKQRRAAPDAAPARRPLPTSPPFSMFVGGLSFDATEQHLRDFFSKDSVCARRALSLARP